MHEAPETSDRILVRLAPGEFVFSAQAVRKLEESPDE